LQRYACPFSNAGKQQRAAWSLPTLFEHYVDLSTRHFIADDRGMPQRRDFVRHVFEQHGIEQLLLASSTARSNGTHDPYNALVEDLYIRARPSASYDISNTLSYRVLEIDFAVTANAEASSLRPAFEQRYMALLPSYDPLSITVVRTVNGLQLRDLLLTTRCVAAYMRLAPEQQAMLTLPGSSAEREALYGKPGEQSTTHEKISL
jgi:hypothetical protein